MSLNFTDWNPMFIYNLILSGVIILLGVHICVELWDLIKRPEDKRKRIWMSMSLIAILGFLLQIIMSTTPIPGVEFTMEKATNHLLIIGLFLVGAIANISTVKVIYTIAGTIK